MQPQKPFFRFLLGAGLGAILGLFVLTYLQPEFGWRLGVLLIVAASTAWAYAAPIFHRNR